MRLIQPYPVTVPLVDAQTQHITVEWAGFLDVVTQVINGAGVAPRSVTGSSPISYTNRTKSDSIIMVSGGTVSSITYTRDTVTFYPVGVTSGQIKVLPGDTVKITFTVAPTITVVER